MNNTDNKRTEEDKVTDMITAEDLAEQALYAANAPDCCTEEEKAKNMLAMLGANVSDETVYHNESEHMRQAVIDRVTKEFDTFHAEMTTHSSEEVFYAAHEISVKSELKDTICGQGNLNSEEYEALYSEAGNLLDNLYNSFLAADRTGKYIETYCERFHPDIMQDYLEDMPKEQAINI